MLKPYFFSRNSRTLMILLGLTMISWVLALSPPSAAIDSNQLARNLSGAGVLLLTFAKVRMVIQNFMEVRDAPLPLRFASDAWLFAALGTLLICFVGQ